MNWRVWIAVGWVCAVGCSGGEAAPRPRGLTDSQGKPKAPLSRPPPSPPEAAREAQPTAARANPAARAQLPSLFDDRGAQTAPGEAPSEPAAAAEEPADEPERDLEAELRRAVGKPSECIDLAAVADRGGELSVSIAAYVLSSGAITRATVDAPGQSSSAVRCIEQQVVSKRLRDPVKGAPRKLATTLTWEVVRAEPLLGQTSAARDRP